MAPKAQSDGGYHLLSDHAVVSDGGACDEKINKRKEKD